MHHLSIDIETYSSVNIAKAGAYKYAQSPDFEILLLAYSWDRNPVEVLDFVGTEDKEKDVFPDWLYQALISPDVIKYAYNAAFEWYCFCRHFRWNPLIEGAEYLKYWRDDMLHSLYCGYPAKLSAAGAALGLPEDMQKMKAGKALIDYFCKPCKPTMSNLQRTRNFPRHAPEKWEIFKEYNRQDVVTEMEINRRLSHFPVPDEIQKQWESDILMNARGIALDMDLVNGALWCSAQVTQELTQEAMMLSGLDNPKSVPQLIKWLEGETGDTISDLRKDTVKKLLDTGVENENVQRMLEIRQELSKTSTKKYDSMKTAICDDGRIRGVLQFYGGNRTGRWAGRILQPQNLPQTHIGALPYVRQMVKERNVDALQMIYGSVADPLSQLIRTAIVPTPGNIFIDADFSAIEARVISWLAGEQWRLEVFQTHGKIYEASASQMFGVPIDRIKKGNPEYALRQKGKVAELALGYQGSTGALIQMKALEMGLKEDELPEIVNRWRKANKRIQDLWYSVGNAALDTLKTGRKICLKNLVFSHEMDSANGLDFLVIQLPSRRKLYYAHPKIGVNKWGGECFHYWGMNQSTKKWQKIDTYGGKLVENITQAVARDCLAEAITRLESAGFTVVFHVHDEVIIDCPKDNANLDEVCRIMSIQPSWAKGLPLKADGWVDEYYKKD